MNREILFKAKRKDNNEWVYGSLISNVNKTGRYFIVENGVYVYKNDDEIINQIIEDKVEVIPETICQYTGLNDMNGKKIFENDIVKDVDDDKYYIVSFDDGSFGLLNLNRKHNSFLHNWNVPDFLVRIGNRFDNPELLEKEVK